MQPKQTLLRGGLFLLLALPLVFAFVRPPQRPRPLPQTADTPRIQVALLLDVSGSMDGLIDQAKAQLWNLVSLLGRAECDRGAPRIELALYEYGRTTNDAAKGYVKQIAAFTGELDSISKSLFALTTNGGDEFCPQAIFTSVQDLAWDKDPRTYKVIFIAGNEDFRQGTLGWEQACAAARARGVVVNTIYCGSREQGVREHWNLSECNGGSYTNINGNARTEDIPTPYDTMLYTLNTRLNSTLIGYGARGAYAVAQVAEVDAMNYQYNKASAAKRAEVKGNARLYKNTAWELVDAYESDSTVVARIDRSTLPDSLRRKSTAQINAVLRAKKSERDAVRRSIEDLSRQRADWLAAERRRRAQATRSANNEATLESEMEKILRGQAANYGLRMR